MHDSDQRIIRERQADLDDAIDRMDRSDVVPGTTVYAQTTTVSSYPASATKFFAVKEVLTVTGTEGEGQTPTLTVGTAVFFAVNLGASVPPNGSTVLVTMLSGGRWAFAWYS